jgi:hypothetical protein
MCLSSHEISPAWTHPVCEHLLPGIEDWFGEPLWSWTQVRQQPADVLDTPSHSTGGEPNGAGEPPFEDTATPGTWGEGHRPFRAEDLLLAHEAGGRQFTGEKG